MPSFNDSEHDKSAHAEIWKEGLWIKCALND